MGDELDHRFPESAVSIGSILRAGAIALVVSTAPLFSGQLPVLKPGAPGVDASAIPEYTNLFEVVEVRPDGTERIVGTWDDRVEIVQRDGRSILRRTQSSKTATGTSGHLDEVDRKTLQPLRARYEANGTVVSDSTWEGRRLTSRDVTTPAGRTAGDRVPVTLSVEFPEPVFDWHLWGMLLSSFPLEDGYEAAFLAHTTSDAEAPLLRRIAFRVAGRETIDLGERGRVDCFVVAVDAGTPWTFWISRTRRPVPVVQLKIEARDGAAWWWRPPGSKPKPDAAVSEKRDGRRDFDFHIGAWKTRLRRLQKPLTGSTSWVEYEGTTLVRKVWDGAANLVELDVQGPAGRIEGLSLRLYNPDSGEWSLNFANRKGGVLFSPTIGAFRNGRGEFYAKEELDGRPILVRFVISDITPTSCRFEQAFSADGGKSWEVNWIAVDERTTS